MSASLHDIVFQNAGAATLSAGIATFGQVFQRGEIPDGATLMAKDSTVTLPVQMDVKTRYEDGSVKMAVLAVQRPALAAGETVELVLTAGPAAAGATSLDLAKGLNGHSFTVDLTIEGGATIRVDVLAELRAALADGSASFWQKGALTSEARIEIDLPGSQRMVFDVAVFKGGGFAVDAQFNNDQAMQATGGRARYDVTVTMDGKVAAQETLNQGQYQNWHQGFASNAHDGGQGIGSPAQGWLNIQHDIAWLQGAGAVARYNLDQPVQDSLLNQYGNATQAEGWGDPLATNGVCTYMPGTGGRPDIGFTTQSNTVWLMTQDARAAAYSMGQADAASAVPWHFRDTANDSWLNTDAYPKLWLDGRGGTGTPGDANSRGLTQQQDAATGWHTDSAHQPDLSYVPYLMTGERWILDNLQSQAAWSIMSYWPSPRGDDSDNVVNGAQVRAAAWSLRQVDEAARMSPDGSPEKAFFREASDANYAWLVSKIPEWTAMQGEAHGWVPGDYGIAGALPPWQQDYFASTVIAAARNGNADARTFLEWQTNFLVGRFMVEDQGFEARDGAAYLIALSDPQTGRTFTSWEEIGAKTVERGWSNGDNTWSKTEGDYGQLALATLSGIYDVTGNPAAKAAYEALVKENVPFTSTEFFAKDPTFALAAPGAAPTQQQPVSVPIVPTAPTPAPAPVAEQLDVLKIGIAQDAWQGDARYTITLDGKQVGGERIATASAAKGEVEYITLTGDFDNAVHKLGVTFLNDAWGGSAETDRNLYVEKLILNDVDLKKSADLMSAGTAQFEFKAATPPTPTPTPAPVPVAEQLDVLKIGIAQDAWQGDARYTITLDGKQVGGERIATASAAKGEVEYITLTGDFDNAVHKLGVTFLNDAWGGSAETDRNLYVEKLILNDVDLKKSADLMSAGTAQFEFKAATPPTPTPTPAPVPVAEQLDVLKIGIAQDAWQGDARYTITLDGKQVGGERIATASAAKGEVEYITLTGDFDNAVHKLGVTFLNDAWGGSAETDRNLYVEKLILNDVDLKKSADLMSAGTAHFEFKAAAQVPAAVATIGSGPDVLRVALSQDAYQGDATFLLFLDGKQLGGERSIDASHQLGEHDFIDIRGDFDAGEHILGVRFTNDIWGGSAASDRNLHVDALDLNGTSLNAQAALMSNGDVFFQF